LKTVCEGDVIPKIIWQTYKSKELPINALDCVQSWIKINPDYEWIYFDDEKCERFISDHFSPEFVSMYQSLPYGVMKADAWRIAIIYVYGGIYADLDTECIQPIKNWTENKNLVVSVEPPNEINIVNFCFAAVAKHSALYYCLENLLINYNGDNFLDKIEKTGTPIQNFGQHAFYCGIKKYFDENPNDDTAKLYTLHDNAFTPFKNEKTLVHHRTASVTWNINYDSWKEQQKKDFGY
jgi:mannosyltransferase OCH1-like enzyme